MRHMLALKFIDAVAKAGSIRAAAETMAITPSALNRRILSVEEELGIEIFERHSLGVRLNSAGELFIQHIRAQMADLERVRSRIADLSGVRLGHVRIATTRGVGANLLPDLIQNYRAQFPGVTFSINTHRRTEVERQLHNLDADIAIVFQPVRLADMHTLIHIQQDIHCILSPDHPLAKRKILRLVDCLEHNPLLPPRGSGVRELVEAAAVKKGLNCTPAVEADDASLLMNLAYRSGGVAFSYPHADGKSAEDGLLRVPLHSGEIDPGFLFVGQLHKRTLPVAASKFVEELRKALDS
ncbi:LysR family transcriptional regulator [Maritalea sp.]|jgi:DNA-binding transcriptional LysR family regulator|uniref:LysR family transcriptional regulator n=1 Tax=Maritalea sp. TaxID=2003361 RepID=UPI0039E315ED